METHFHEQNTMFRPPLTLGIPFVINLFTDHREEKAALDSRSATPMLSIAGTFQVSTKAIRCAWRHMSRDFDISHLRRKISCVPIGNSSDDRL